MPLNDYQLQLQYGITLEDFDRMMSDQRNSCAICHELLVKPCVDHDHETGVVRGLLCSNCNSGLGMFKDDIRLLAGAIVYLEDSELMRSSMRV